MRNMIEGYLEESSTLKAEELLSDEAYRSGPTVGVKGKYGSVKIFLGGCGIDSIRDLAWDTDADRQIEEVYTARNPKVVTPAVAGPKVFTPVATIEWWD